MDQPRHAYGTPEDPKYALPDAVDSTSLDQNTINDDCPENESTQQHFWIDESIYANANPYLANQHSTTQDNNQSPTHTPPELSTESSKKHHLFTRALLATVASTIIPGLGLITATQRGPRLAGRIISGLAVLGGMILAVWAIFNFKTIASFVVRPRALQIGTYALIVLGLFWICLIVGTLLIRRPKNLTKTQRGISAIAVTILSFAVAAPTAVAAQYMTEQALLISTVFHSDHSRSQTRPTLSSIPGTSVWNTKTRLNILLVGGDTDQHRIETIKNRPLLTDTIMVASIDTKTGAITLIQIPRNMARTPFPPDSKLRKLYPYGYYDGYNPDNPEYMANAIWSNIPRDHPHALSNTDYPGADALKLGIGQAIGLRLDFFVMLNIDGLQKLIDAMGGVTVNINQRLPIGGNSENPGATSGWLQPGPNQHLSGYKAMWYARSRWSTDDYSRMARQSCLVNAIIKQADPMTMLTRYEAVAKASSQMIETDIPQNLLPDLVELALRVKSGKFNRVLFQHGVNGFNTENPNFRLMKKQVAAAIEGSESTISPTDEPEPSQSQSSKHLKTPSAKSKDSDNSDNKKTHRGKKTTTSMITPSENQIIQASPLAAPQKNVNLCAYNPVQPTKRGR